jgi:flavin reductase (DIM6/NTAB) family NADH-FMN oxidoreductase RutF
VTPPDAPVPDALALRRAFSCFPTGVAALAAVVDDQPVGMAVSSFTSVSLDPPLAAVCVGRSSGTWVRLRRSAELGVSVLSAEQGAAGRRLSSREPDRFAGLSWDELPGQALLVHGAAATLRTRVDREVEAGDHLLVLLEVLAVEAFLDVDPLVFHASAFHRLETP